MRRSSPQAQESSNDLRANGTPIGKGTLDPDSLGHASDGKLPPIWRRWNITYAGTMQDFLRRSIEVHEAFEATRSMLGDEL